ncbi:MAG: SUMF1/EgtB/PvdO family nonheme iron enzyme [Candidatus Coatesbacteria bacterium]|nr:SUMF1/EgtB/PvdO family nonheme iron enzyme [Candidatus Coatesbacteria bacterium]
MPTEAQWEYAARAFSLDDYPWGNDRSCDFGNICVTDGYSCEPFPVPVRSYPPNGFGLYEVSGNSTEMCSDWFDLGIDMSVVWGQTYYEWCLENYPDGIVNPQGPPDAPPGITVNEYFPYHVMRGGPPNEVMACMMWARHTCLTSPFDCFRVVLEPPK